MKKASIDLTKEYFHSVFEYREGELYWKIKPCRRVYIGNMVGPKPRKYKSVSIRGCSYRVHRIIWVMFNGEIPNGVCLDHIDCNPLNNKIENLRLATNLQNRVNSSYMGNTKSGYKGVRKRRYGWEAVIGFNGKKIYLGNYRTVELAKEVYDKKAIELYGEFATSG